MLFAVIFFFGMPDDLSVLLPCMVIFKDADSIEVCSVISMVIDE